MKSYVKALILVLCIASSLCALAQTTIDVEDYLSHKIGLSPDQMNAVRNGQSVAKALDTNSPSEVFVFGVVYVNAMPGDYFHYAYDMNRLRKTPGFLGVNKVSNPPKESDFVGFAFGEQDVKSLKSCKPGDCDVQFPGATIAEMNRTINWSSSNVADQVNQFLVNAAMTRLPMYIKDGDRTLGIVYNDKEQAVNVGEEFQRVLSKPNAFLPLPSFYAFLLQYPQGRPPNTQDFIYWSNVKFGLKPTLRLVQVVSMEGSDASIPALTIAEKQLYSSHYFETALNITYCVKGNDDPKKPGFYLIQVMGSEQAGLTGFKGSIVRKVAVDKSVTGLQKSLAQTKSDLETALRGKTAK